MSGWPHQRASPILSTALRLAIARRASLSRCREDVTQSGTHQSASFFLPIVFSFLNPRCNLCKRAEELCDRHFLDLSLEEQQVIRELVEEQQQSARVQTEGTDNQKKEARKQFERVEHEQRVVRKEERKLQSKIQKRGRSYSKLLPNLRFDTAALERLEWLEKNGVSLQIEAELGQMNAGRLVYRDSIANTDPKIYEAKAGWDYRIYFYQDNSRTCIRLIGDKDTQESDIKQLRTRARGAFA